MSFDAAKSSLLESLASGIDFSPKGSIDAPIVHLVDFVNGLPDFVTTSSCSGRISLYRDENSTKGIKWLKVVHGTVTAQQLKDAVTDQESTAAGNHFVALKCEGFILHIRCRDLDSGRRLHQVAMSCGFRESGLSVGQKMRVQLSIRTTAFGLELPIAVGRNLILDDNALDIIVSEANRRLRCNFARTDRLLNSMKREYSWPSMTCRSLPHSNIQRWGHSCSNGSGDSFMIIGGYGTDSSHLGGGVTSESPQSTRKLSNICYSEANADPKMFNLLKTEQSRNDISMHAGSAMLDIGGVSLLLISGGRESPQEALSCLRVFKINSMNNESNITNFEIMEYDISGDVPASRWGHTFTTLGPSAASNNFILYGGRNEKQIFGDSYLLSAEYSETVLKFIWRKISSSSGDVMKSTSAPFPRFFHAACLVYVTDSIDIEKNQKHKELNGILNFDQSTRVLIHGGLLSLEDPTTCGCAYILDVRTGEWSAVPNIASSSTKNENINTFNGDADDAGHDFPVSTDDHIESTKRDNIDDTVSSVQKHGHAYVQNFFVQKFGHSITDIGGKTLVMSGGTAFEDPGSADSDMKYEGLCALDLSMNDNAELCASVRGIVVSGVDGNECGDTRDIGGTKLDSESASAVTALPCGDCRCHHTAVYDKQSKSLLLHGGGALCLSFGAHYCTSISLQIKSGINSINSTIPCGVTGENPQVKNPSNSHFPGANNENSAMSKEATVVLLVLQSRVKLVKNFLENQKISWLDKERRITLSEISDDDITFLPITNFSLTQNDFQAFDDITKMNKIKEKEMKSVKKEAVSLLISPSNDDKIFKKNVKSENQSLMAVPITSVLADLLNKGDRGLSSPLIRELCLCLGSDYFMDNSNVNCTSTNSEELNSGILELNIRIGRQAVRVKKSLLASGYRKADEYLESVIREYGLPSSASSFFPRKYEFVGNVLMIPEESLKGIWEGLLPAPLSGSDAQSLSQRNKIDGRAVRIWTGLAACFGVEKVARKARVDSGPKRESRVLLLLPALGQPESTGPGSPGWVEVIENSIRYGFDVTRVMFCSGNCTERIRMGKEVVKGEVIVDLYCGVGYYTIPFLLHGKAAHVHACEWNTNSLIAIKENLRKAGEDVVSRCTVYEGDNKMSAALLVGVADRVCLGLLPSSTQGWPLAVSVLKNTGGVLHVHENVRDIEVGSWTVDSCQQFMDMFRANGIPMTVTCRHTEIVKSYAPHVVHIVVDLVCTPI